MTRYDFRSLISRNRLFNSLILLFCLVGTGFSQDFGKTRSNGLEVFELGKPKSSCCGASLDGKSITALSSPETEYETYKLTATYYTLRDNLSATLMFNNKGPQAILATPTFYSLAGTRLQLAAISVPATSYIDVDMHQLLAGASDEFREGSLKISYQGISQQLGAQVKLVDPQNSLIWAEQLSYTTKYVSSRLEGVWWLPYENSETRIVVSNTSSGIVSATVTADGTSPSQSSPTTISLNPWETRVLDILSNIVGHTNGHIHEKGGVSIAHTGSPGAVIARIFIAKPNKGYSSAINFLDPEATVSSRWHGNGLRLRNINGAKLYPVLIARNNGGQPSKIQGKIYFTKPNGSQDFVVIPQRTISANSTRVIELDNFIEQANVPNSVAFGGIELDYDTPKGTVITSVQSVSQNGNHVFQVPMFDPQNMPASAAGFPWKADGDFRTIVYVKNVTDQPRKYVTYLKYEGGTYSIRESDIAPHQTIAIDFRQLRDSQTHGAFDAVIPLNIDKGQIGWSMIGNENKTLSTRSEQISLSRAVASTYSCGNCCPSSRFIDTVNPGYASIGVYDTEQFFTIGIIQDCMQNTTPIQGGGDWSSSNVSIAAVNGGGLAEGMSPGEATITAQWMNFSWIEAGPSNCWYSEYPGQDSAPMTVGDDIIFHTATNDFNNQSASFSTGPGVRSATINLSGQACTNQTFFHVTINFTLPFDSSSIHTDSRSFFTNGVDKQFEHFGFRFEDVSHSSHTGKLVLTLKRIRPNASDNINRFVISGARQGGGSFIGAGRLVFNCS